MRVCSVCGEDAVDRGGSRSRAYCSEPCRWEDRPDVVCPGCRSVFRSKDAKAIYCSQRCREAGRRVICDRCGESFHPGVDKSLRVCLACRASARAEAVAARRDARAAVARGRAERRAVLWASRACRGCGIVFVPAHWRAVFHDADCRERFGRHREGIIERRRRTKLVRRRFRAQVYARDGSRCYLCRQSIDQAIPFPDPWSPSIDHVMPMSAGGSDELANLRAAHLGCNIEKGDRLPYWWERAA